MGFIGPRRESSLDRISDGSQPPEAADPTNGKTVTGNHGKDAPLVFLGCIRLQVNRKAVFLLLTFGCAP